MKKSVIILIAVIAVIAIWAVSSYNGMVSMEENVSNQWANVETQYQRRSDLIPNLVNTVKGYASHEKETLEGVIAARSQATQMKVDPSNLTPEAIAKYQKAQGEIGAALGKLLAITENYPDLKANQNFLELQRELSDTENKIQAARRFYNGNVRDLNIKMESFPSSILASIFHFQKMEFFDLADNDAAQNPVEVKF